MSKSAGLTGAVADERPELLMLCGAAGVAGQIAATALLFATMAVVGEYDFVADTISKLAKGPHAVIMDTGFYLSAASLLALAIGAAHLHLGRWDWSLGIFALALLALIVTLLGIWDEFHERPNPETVSVHARLTYALLPLYAAGPVLMARGISRVWGWAGAAFVAASLAWIVLATWFFFSSDGHDGLIEKAAFAATYLWTLPLGALLFRRGLAQT